MSQELQAPTLHDALGSVVSVGRLLTDTTFDEAVDVTPALVLQAIPSAHRVEITVRRPGHRRPMRAAASRGTEDTVLVDIVDVGRLSLSHVIALPPVVEAGVLTLWTDAPSGFDTLAELTAEALVGQLEVALKRASDIERAAHLGQALQSNRDIGVAVGLVMASRSVDRDVAFEILRHLSQDTNRRLADVAAEIIDIGTGAHPPALRLITSDPVVH